MQTRIPCVLMRGGTSKGPFFLASDLPDDPELRNQVLLNLMGSPDNRQIDGIGGADSLTSKVAIVSPSARDDAGGLHSRHSQDCSNAAEKTSEPAVLSNVLERNSKTRK